MNSLKQIDSTNATMTGVTSSKDDVATKSGAKSNVLHSVLVNVSVDGGDALSIDHVRGAKRLRVLHR